MGSEVTVAEMKGPQPAERRSRRRTAADGVGAGAALRFFLAQEGANGSPPVLDQELDSENDALVASLRSGLSYYAVVEYRAMADTTGRAPRIRKEALKRPK